MYYKYGVNQVLFGRIGLGQFCIPPASIRHYYISFWWFTLWLFIGQFPSCEGSPTYCIQWIVSSIQSARTGQRLYRFHTFREDSKRWASGSTQGAHHGPKPRAEEAARHWMHGPVPWKQWAQWTSGLIPIPSGHLTACELDNHHFVIVGKSIVNMFSIYFLRSLCIVMLHNQRVSGAVAWKWKTPTGQWIIHHKSWDWSLMTTGGYSCPATGVFYLPLEFEVTSRYKTPTQLQISTWSATWYQTRVLTGEMILIWLHVRNILGARTSQISSFRL